jgi:hypothetical protein
MTRFLWDSVKTLLASRRSSRRLILSSADTFGAKGIAGPSEIAAEFAHRAIGLGGATDYLLVRSSGRTRLLPSSPLRTVLESFPSHGSSPSNASRETRFGNGQILVMDGAVALWMKQNVVLGAG